MSSSSSDSSFFSSFFVSLAAAGAASAAAATGAPPAGAAAGAAAPPPEEITNSSIFLLARTRVKRDGQKGLTLTLAAFKIASILSAVIWIPSSLRIEAAKVQAASSFILDLFLEDEEVVTKSSRTKGLDKDFNTGSPM